MSRKKKIQCISTHGGAGYAPGSYRDKDGKLRCGVCNEICMENKIASQWVDRPDWNVPKKKSWFNFWE